MSNGYTPIAAGSLPPPPAPRSERDPNGIDAHTPGAKLDAGKPRVALIIRDMPRALLAVAEVATVGAAKYTEGGWLLVPNGLSRYADAQDRHRLKEGIEPRDTDTGLLHAAHGAWNALARLELMLRAAEAEGGAE